MALFLRMAVMTVVNLYAVRIVLERLGHLDYGIYNTVAGVVTFSAFLSSSLALSIQRFYSVAKGEENAVKEQDVFRIGLRIMVALCVLVVLFFETVGLWMVYQHLNIPANRLSEAVTVYHCCLLTLVCSFLQVPFQGALFANEHMGSYAAISLIECLLKLGAACLLGLFANFRLTYYGLMLLAIGFMVMLIYAVYAMMRYPECSFGRITDKTLYRRILTFSSWSIYGSLISCAMTQGNNVLLSAFFGPLIVASFAVTLQINNALNTLSSNVIVAFRPSLIQAYAANMRERVRQLFAISNKALAFALIAITVPLMLEIKTVLTLWLGDNLPPLIVPMARLMMVQLFILALNNPISMIVHATGQLKKYSLYVETTTGMCVPVAIVLLAVGMSPLAVIYAMIATTIIAHVLRIVIAGQQTDVISMSSYVKDFVVPMLPVLLCAVVLSSLVCISMTEGLLRLSAVVAVAIASSAVSAYIFGLKAEERHVISKMVKNKLNLV